MLSVAFYIGMLSDINILKVIVLNIVMLHINFLSAAYAECSIFIGMLSAVMLSVIILKIVALDMVMLSTIYAECSIFY